MGGKPKHRITGSLEGQDQPTISEGEGMTKDSIWGGEPWIINLKRHRRWGCWQGKQKARSNEGDQNKVGKKV